MSTIGIIGICVGYFITILLVYYVINRWLSELMSEDNMMNIFLSVVWPLTLCGFIFVGLLALFCEIFDFVFFKRIKKLAEKHRYKDEND